MSANEFGFPVGCIILPLRNVGGGTLCYVLPVYLELIPKTLTGFYFEDGYACIMGDLDGKLLTDY